ncbi:MG2 domain-containing protein [Pedobacter gandavensis]|uniref:alpha-2-macroglobulin family protein n=1 Tax=Pedobacter gandavensis TaxID=2679963 RepID=UPI0029314B70|nr:MG2 domain-containing protein [Pedobacter gandavensis]
MNLRSFLLALLLAFALTTTGAYAQSLTKDSWTTLETAIATKKNLVETLNKVNQEKSAARLKGNDIAFARYSYYGMQIKDLKTEDSLFFKNSAFIDSTLLAPGSSKLLKTMMHLLQAKRIQEFRRKGIRFKPGSNETKSQKYNYAGMIPQQTDSVIKYHFKTALALALSQNTGAISEELRWLSSSANQLIFPPDLADLIISENIVYEVSNNKLSVIYIDEQQASRLILANPTELLQEIRKITGTKSADSALFSCYLNWMERYKADSEKSLYIQSLFKYLLYVQYPLDENVAKAWKSYLHENLSSKHKLLDATAAYQLFLIHFIEGSKYGFKFEDKYKGQLGLAVKIYEQNKQTLDQFPVYKTHLEQLLKKIKAKEFRFRLENRQIPGQPILITGKYRNARVLHYRIVKIGVEEQFSKLKSDRIIAFLKKASFRDSSFTLPNLPDDYDKHAAYLKIDALPVGAYAILFSINEPVAINDTAAIEELRFLVTNLAAVNIDDRFMVLDRKTGQPVSGVKVKSSYQVENNNHKITIAKTPISYFQSDAKGCVIIGGKRVNQFLLTSGKDSLDHQYSSPTQALSKKRPHNDDDLDEFYSEKSRLHIYTDRSIYRPGQRVFYKAILLTKNLVTGETEVFNQENSPYLRKWLKENNPKLSLRDPNYKTIDTIKFEPDAYGSFSGSFLIAKNVLPGNWEITTNDLETQDANFKVEEYKRPSLEMTMEKPKETPMPGEAFELKLKVKSLSGADLKNVKIAYRLERNFRVATVYNNEKKEILDTIGYTDEKGELLIQVKAEPVTLKTTDKELLCNYQLEATATESTGESTALNDQYSISSWPVKVNVPLASHYDRKDLPTLSINAKSEIARYKPDRVTLSLYQLEEVPDTLNNKTVDQWLYRKEELKKWFPNLEQDMATKQNKRLVFSKEVTMDEAGKFELNKELLPVAAYELLSTTKKSGQLTGQSSVNFKVFDSQERTAPADFSYLPINSVSQGEKITYYSALPDRAYVTYSLSYYIKTAKGLARKITYNHSNQDKGLEIYSLNIPKDAIQSLLLSKVYVLNNQLYTTQESFYLKTDDVAAPEIIIEKYRKILAPGAKETFSVSIKTTKENIAAQLMTVMYDASLDKLEPHYWNKPNKDYPDLSLYNIWTYTLKDILNSSPERYWPLNNDFINDQSEYGNSIMYQLQGRVPGLSIPVGNGANNTLQEVVVMRGYSSTSSIKIRGKSSLSAANQAMVIVDGIPYTGSLDDLKTTSESEFLVLKGAEAVAIYGSSAANGVLIINTKGKIILPNAPAEPKAIVRKDFNETAFFYPNVYADKDGLYTFSFTMPQTATAWNWKMLAHTQKGLFAYAERKLHTQLNLMVQPNMPRLLYQGDELFLKSRISNLDSIAMDVKFSCRIEDAITGEDLTEKLLNKQALKMVKLAAKQTGSDGFFFKVPENQLNPLKIITRVICGGLADAEEHTLPIISRKTFVRQQFPVRFSTKDSLLKAPQLPADAEIYGMSMYIDPKPQAAILYALPYLANYAYDCAEQTFNKLFAVLTAEKLMKTTPAIKEAFDMASKKIVPDTSTSVLPDELSEAATPWLNLANRTAKQQKQLYQILDPSANKKVIAAHLEKLYKMQNGDGGLPWFEGGQTNNWISNYLIRGFGQLQQAGWKAPNQGQHEQFIKKLITYSDLYFSNNKADASLYYAYARSFWKTTDPIAAPVLKQIKETLVQEHKTIDRNTLYTQALWITVASKYTFPDEAISSGIESQRKQILQLAIQDDQHGLRWKEISNNEDLNHSKEETIAMLHQAFAQNKSVNNGLIKWILGSRQGNNWTSTVGTAAAIEMIEASAELATSYQPDSVSAKVAGQQIKVSNNLLTGTPTQFVPLSKPLTITAHANPGATAGFTWYYFSTSANVDSLNTKVKLSKKLSVFDPKKSAWVALNPAIGVKIGDKVKVILRVETAQPLRFLQIDDKRAAGFEPIEHSSGQRYLDGIRYYQAIRDTGQQLFIDFLPSGRSEFSYEVTVSQEGNFRNGPAVLQCLYQPGITAYSNSIMILSKSDQ